MKIQSLDLEKDGESSASHLSCKIFSGKFLKVHTASGAVCG